MELDNKLAEIVRSVLTSFPDLVPYFDEWVDRQGHSRGEYPPYWVLERFADATTQAIVNRNEALANAYLELIERVLNDGDEGVEKFLDVSYCENLMWDVKDVKLKRWGWSILPRHIQRLYTDMWGKP